jgi:hypothetical protein
MEPKKCHSELEARIRTRSTESKQKGYQRRGKSFMTKVAAAEGEEGGRRKKN